MAMLTQEELDKLPHHSKLWYVHWTNREAKLTGMAYDWNTSRAEYFRTKQEAEEHIKLQQLINKLKGT